MIKNIVLFIVMLIASQACVISSIEPSDSTIENFEVHFQSAFNEDDVLLRIDHTNVFVGNLSTDYTISLAKIIKLQAMSGRHSVYINVNNRYFSNTEFELNDSLYILISFTDENENNIYLQEGIEISFTQIPPLYD